MRAAPIPPAPQISLDLVNDHLRELNVAAKAIGVTPCAGGLSNHNYRIEFADRSVALLRIYRWWHDEPEPERRTKEPWLHRLLHDAGVPVPRVIASSERAALMEWIDGEKLRQVGQTEPPSVLDRAWREAGAALRTAHALTPFDEPTAGNIVGDRLVAFDRPWSEWNAVEIRTHVSTLRALDAISSDNAARVDAICDRLPTLLGEVEVTLVHNDAHPANVLVARARDDWRLAAWIDWEYAWIADPDWDLARFAFFGASQVGQVPEAFWSGYGRRPSVIRNAIYELHMISWLGGFRPERRAPTAPELLARERLTDIQSLLTVIERS